MTAADESLAEQADEHAELWLSPGQLSSWLSVVRLMTRLPWAIDAQLQRDADLSMIEYMTMAILSETPDWTMRMSDLAERTSASLSRLSHLVKRLENRGYVRREADLADGRFTNAILLPAGRRSWSRRHRITSLTCAGWSSTTCLRSGCAGLGQDADRIVGRIDSPAR